MDYPSDEQAMEIFHAELARQPTFEPVYGPEPMGQVGGIDKEAVILAAICLIAMVIGLRIV
jgi:hypothetical protein